MVYINLIENLLKNIGGKNNVVQVKNNVTRIIFTLRDNSIVNILELNKVSGIYKIIFVKDQLNVVIGNKVKDVFEELIFYMNNVNFQEIKVENIKNNTNKDNFLKRYLKDIERDINSNYSNNNTI